MKKPYLFFLAAILLLNSASYSQTHVAVTVSTSAESRKISPYIFGRNNNLSDNQSSPLSAAKWQNLKDLGIRMFRENGGNNATKYNWRLKLSSHPDWYNNVYGHDWDYSAKSLGTNIPGAQGMWAFQLIGMTAANTSHNFNDYGYNGSNWWSGVGQNLAGGGILNPSGGGNALKNGNPNLYLKNWPADSTTGILKHWFGPGGIGLDSTKIRYWSMDNEIEIWNGTHDDVDSIAPTAEEFMQKYFAVAKAARAIFPGIKLLGPVPANEWQWYNYPGGKISYNGHSYVWLEYFILRCAEEEQATGIRLLDVIDIHFYPGESAASDIVQLHRIFFDETYNYPGANGVKVSGPGGWDNSITKEYIFKRCNNWLTQYMGSNHGVTLSVSETGFNAVNPNVSASLYASTIGEFAKNGVEVFTPWSWQIGMNEVIHLFSRFSKAFYINGNSTDEFNVSAYPTINSNKDSLVLYLVNRNLTESRVADLDLIDFPVKDGSYKTYTIANLPANETFISHASNALVQGNIQISANKPSIILAPLSITAVVLTKQNFNANQYGYIAAEAEAENGVLSGVTVSIANPGYSGTGYVTGFDNTGDMVSVSMNVPEAGLYKLVIRYNGSVGDKYQDLLINNTPAASVHFPAISGYDNVEAGNYYFNKGTNSVAIKKGWGWTDIDKFELYPTVKNIYNITPLLVDSLANDTTKALYNFLLNQFGSRIISGQTDDYYDSLKILAGYSPIIRNGDLNNYTPGYPYLWNGTGHSFGIVDNGGVEKMINWYKSTGGKGIVAYQWHWCSPIGGSPGTNTFYTDYTNFDITRAVTPGTLEDSLILRDLDLIAAQLNKFQAAGIPILWRPLHEAGGGWFWWGAKGPAACKQLYNIMYDRFTNYHHLHNLIWVWSTPETDWYPGNEIVDIIGYDSYPGSYNYGNQKAAFDVIYNLTGGKKLVTMSENGPIPDIDACLSGDTPWSYFMSWSNLVRAQNSLSHIQQVFANQNVLKLESTNAKTSREWRSSLYPETWIPGFKDADGRFLHDFSYAGYHSGLDSIPEITHNIIDVTQAPYNADNSGTTDATDAIQQALNDVGNSGGGVVYLPPGTFKISAPDTLSYALVIKNDSTILRGAGASSTFLVNEKTSMRHKDIILIKNQNADWFDSSAGGSLISTDLPEPTRLIPVQSVSGMNKGDFIVVSSTPTPAFIEELNMTGKWNPSAIKGIAFLRQIDTIDAPHNLIVIDAPTRYSLKTRDFAKVYRVKKHISECGIENLSLANVENTTSGWSESDQNIAGTGAYEVDGSNAIELQNAINCWVKNVHSFKPDQNLNDVHILSNGVYLNQSRNISIDSCDFRNSQYSGSGRNGSNFILESNDCLIENSIAANSRENFSFKYPYSNGNVILRSRAENSTSGIKFDGFLSMANLLDQCTLDSDFIAATYLSEGDSSIGGYSTTQSVFYNTKAESYHSGKTFIIDSRQLGNGYIIGSSGNANQVQVYPLEGIDNGSYFNTRPIDFTEGIGNGQYLVPASLYLDQLSRRKTNPPPIFNYTVHVIIKDASSNQAVSGCQVILTGDTLSTDSTGSAIFSNVMQVFSLNANHKIYLPYQNSQIIIHSDTSLTVSLTKKTFQVSLKMTGNLTKKPIAGVIVTFFNQSKTTSSSGVVSYSVTGGIYNYQLGHPYYQSSSGSLNLFSDSSINFTLSQTAADARFWLKEGAAAVNNAYVKIGNDSLLTGGLGMVVFLKLANSTDYHYVISKNGYQTSEGDFYLNSDTALTIAMSKSSGLSEITNDKNEIKLWPNPMTDVLNCAFPSANSANTVRITNLVGNTIYLNTVNSKEILINVKDMPAGVYLVRVSFNNSESTRMFVKK